MIDKEEIAELRKRFKGPSAYIVIGLLDEIEKLQNELKEERKNKELRRQKEKCIEELRIDKRFINCKPSCKDMYFDDCSQSFRCGGPGGIVCPFKD